MNKVFVFAFAGFLFVQLLAVFVGGQFIGLVDAGLAEPMLSDPSDPANSVFFFAYIVLSAVALLFVLKYYKGNKLFLLLELALVFISFQTLALFFDETGWFSLLVGAAAVGLRLWKPVVRNPLLLVCSAVVGGLLGASFDLLPAVLLAVLLSAYDVIAVFYTKHMITLAKELGSRDATFSVRFSENPLQPAPALRVVKPHGPNAKRNSMELGTGDLVIPAFLAAACLKVPGKVLLLGGFSLSGAAVAAVIGSLAGMLFIFVVLQKRGGYLPALPPLAGGALLAIATYLVV
ncbi:TPA: hypothetical protein HA318_01845 [Candidatus Micrarchaeota archaeon]|nr:hypothetical protein [Candidatus Micrarchaeota archaeon]